MEQTPVFENDTGRLSSDLDRVEIKVGKIGLNSPEASLSILTDMDSIYERMQAQESERSRKQADAQLAGISGKLHHEASTFLRDLGGVSALRKARDAVHPPEDHWWWFLDVYLAQKRQAALKRSLITLAGIAVVFVILALVYNRFLAPDPKVAARYGHEQSARDALVNGNLDQALSEIAQGLAVVPNDPTLLMLRGVVEEKQGNQTAAAQDYAASEKAFGSRETFLLARGQAYSMGNMQDKALADAQAVIQMNPKSGEAYLLAGNAYEGMQRYQDALNEYNKSFDAASATGQTELAAMSRMRIAMVMQLMGAQPVATGTPAP